MKTLSKERITRTLRNLGLSQVEVKLYLFLAKEGPQTTKSIANSIMLTEDNITIILKHLLEKNLIEKTKDRSYSAKSFQEAIDLLVKFNFEESDFLESNKKAILIEWKALIEKSEH